LFYHFYISNKSLILLFLTFLTLLTK